MKLFQALVSEMDVDLQLSVVDSIVFECPTRLNLTEFLEWRKLCFPFEEFTAQMFVESWVTPFTLRNLTGLGNITVSEMFDVIASITDSNGLVERDSLVDCLPILLADSLPVEKLIYRSSHSRPTATRHCYFV